MARGHVRKHGNRWEVRIYAGIDPVTGKERRVTRTTRTLKEAEKLRTRLLNELDDGGHTGPDATLRELLDQWQAVKAPRLDGGGWSPKNAMETAGYVDRWIAPPADSPRHKWAPGRLAVSDLTPSVLDAFNQRLLREPLAPATVRRIHGVVRAALEQAVRWDWITRNPAARTEPIDGVSPEQKPPPTGDLRTLLTYTAKELPAVHLFVRLAFITGRRRGELCALRWSDMDWEGTPPSVLVARTLADSADDGWVERPISKNKRPAPPIALDRVTVDLLREHRAHTAGLLVRAGLELTWQSWVFLSVRRDGIHPWSPDAAGRRFTRACEAAGVPRTHLHQLRHKAATEMLDGGISPTSAGGRLGHGGGGRVTQEVYAHSLPATDLAAAELLAELIDGD